MGINVKSLFGNVVVMEIIENAIPVAKTIEKDILAITDYLCVHKYIPNFAKTR